jgi:nitrogen-specific signal transduction histidine kinase
MNTPNPPGEITIPLDRVARFVRQLTHDVRNGLSAIDLETAFIAEISADEEVLAELHKLREMISETAKMLRRVSQYFHPVIVHPIPWSAATVMQEIQKTAETEFPDEEVGFENRFQDESVHIDLQLTLTVVLAVLRNSLQFRRDDSPVTVTGALLDGKPSIEIRERRTENPIAPTEWGVQPLLSTRPGGYGLELYQARQVVAAQGGSLDIEPDGDQLVTRLVLPVEALKEE